jgi:low temperature requirement protein LtrA
MLASLLMTVAIPEAFGDRALLFVGSYVAIQVGRHLFLTFVVADAGTIERERSGHILAWFVASGALWLAGGFADDSACTALWLAALAIDYAAPMARPALYLLGHALFRLRMAGSVSWKRLTGAAACVAVGALGSFAPALVLAALLVEILIGVIASEHVAARRRRRRGEPSPMQRLESAGS